MTTLTTRARDLRSHSTAAERALWALLRARRLGGHKFRRQVPLGRYIVDFLCPDQHLIIELDGGQHQDPTPYEARRTAWLNANGYHPQPPLRSPLSILRLWNTELLEDPHAAADYILTKLPNDP